MNAQPEKERADVLLTEYKELRAEIRHYLDRRQKTIHFAFIVTLGVLGAEEKLQTGWLALFAGLLIAFLWYDEIRSLQAVFRVATYIQIIIEPRIRDFHWETMGGKHPIQTGVVGRAFANGMFPSLYLGSVGYGIVVSDFSRTVDVVIAVLYLSMFGYLLFRSYDMAKRGRQTELNAWKTVEKEHSDA